MAHETGAGNDQPHQRNGGGRSGGQRAKNPAIGHNAFRGGVFGYSHGIGGQKFQKRIVCCVFLGERKQPFVERRNGFLSTPRRPSAIQPQERNHQAEADGERQREKQTETRRSEARRREGERIDNQNQNDGCNQRRQCRTRDATRNGTPTKSRF